MEVRRSSWYAAVVLVQPSEGVAVEGMRACERVVAMAPDIEDEAVIFVVAMGQDLDGGNSKMRCQ